MAQLATDQQTPESTEIQKADIIQMTEDLFQSMLNIAISPLEEDKELPNEGLQASIRISGAWQAELHVIASETLTELIACVMFGAEAGELEQEEKLDALGEVVNVIGGNVKGIIDSECTLSLPCVGSSICVESENPSITMFDCWGETLYVALVRN